MEVERIEDADANHRRLVAVSRLPSTPPLLVVDHDPRTASWRVIGEGDGRGDAASISWRERLLNVLPNSDPGITQKELESLTRKQRKDWGQALNGLVEEGLVVVSGRGVTNDPKRYRRAPADSVIGLCSDAITESNRLAPDGDVDDSVTSLVRTESSTSPNEAAAEVCSVPRNELSGDVGVDGDARTAADLADDELLAIFPGSTLERPVEVETGFAWAAVNDRGERTAF